MQLSTEIVTRRRLRWIGPASYLLGLFLGCASLTITGCGDDKGGMNPITPTDDPAKTAKASMDSYLKQLQSKKSRTPVKKLN